jgi:hypothetical protein
LTGPILKLLYFQPLGISGSVRPTLVVVHCVLEAVESCFGVDMAYCGFGVVIFDGLDAVSGMSAAVLVKTDKLEKATSSDDGQVEESYVGEGKRCFRMQYNVQLHVEGRLRLPLCRYWHSHSKSCGRGLRMLSRLSCVLAPAALCAFTLARM